MAEDNLNIQFYLTENGWREGTRKFFGSIQGNKRIRPRTAIATFELHIYQRSGFSPEKRSWKEIWRSAEISSQHINTLLIQFGTPDENTKF
jgi:hypothetical protein